MSMLPYGAVLKDGMVLVLYRSYVTRTYDSYMYMYQWKRAPIKRHLGAKNSGTGSRVVSPDFSTDLESPAQELSGKIVRSHSRQLEAPVWENCPFVGWPGK